MSIGLTHYLTFAGLLFIIGLTGVLTRKNVIAIYMCVELMLVACTVVLAAFARFNNSLDGLVFVLFVLAVAAAEVAVGLALIVAFYRRRESVSTDEMRTLRH